MRTLKYSGLSVPKIVKPSKKDPSPRDINANIGIIRPPPSKPIPFNVSLIATDFNPPKMAYELPRSPIAAATTQREIFKSNIVINASEPVYRTTGNSTVT